MSEVFWWYNETLTIQKAPEKDKIRSDFNLLEYWTKRRLQRGINTFQEQQDTKKETYEFLLWTNPDESHFFYEDC